MIFYSRRLLPLLGSMLVDDTGRKQATATGAALGLVALAVCVAITLL